MDETEKIPVCEHLVRVDYAAEVLGKSRDAVHKMVQKNIIRHVRQGQVIYFKVKWLTEYVNSLPDCIKHRKKGNQP